MSAPINETLNISLSDGQLSAFRGISNVLNNEVTKMVVLTVFGMEWIIIVGAIVLLLVFGPKKLPKFARGLGKATAEFRRGKIEVERQIREDQIAYKHKQAVEKEANDLDKKLITVARELGIDIEGKSEKELKREIARMMAD